MWAVFSRFGKIEEKNYALFLLSSAIMVWTFFSQSISQSLTSIIKNRQLIQKIYVPKLVFPIATVTSNLVNLFFFLIAYLGIALATPVGWSSTILLIIPVSLILFAMTAGIRTLLGITQCLLSRLYAPHRGPLKGALLPHAHHLSPKPLRPGDRAALKTESGRFSSPPCAGCTLLSSSPNARAVAPKHRDEPHCLPRRTAGFHSNAGEVCLLCLTLLHFLRSRFEVFRFSRRYLSKHTP